MKKIWLICLCLASLSLVGCFHVPDKDWLPSKNKVENWDIGKNDEMEKAFDSFMNGIEIASKEWNEIKNKEDVEIDNELPNEASVDTEEEISDNEAEYQEIENISEE